MKILTSQDYDRINCCGCGLPSCPEPRKACESLYGEGRMAGFINDNLPPEEWYEQFFAQLKYQYQDAGGESGHWIQWTVEPMANIWVGGVQVQQAVSTREDGGGNGYGQPMETTYSGPVTSDQAKAGMLATIQEHIDWENEEMNKGSESSSSIESWTQFGVGVTYARYRFGVPEGFSTPEAPRSTWEMRWDEVFFPEAYDQWVMDAANHREAVAAHEAWEACEAASPGQCGEEPEIPPDPGPAPAQPTVVANREWTWGGSMDAPWSPWFEIPLPEGRGQTRTVNILVKCYKSTRIGVKPTAHGESYRSVDSGPQA